MKGSDIISVLFLVLVSIIISSLVTNISPTTMIIPTYVLIAVCLWIAFDYMLLKRYRNLVKKNTNMDNLVIDEIPGTTNTDTDLPLPKSEKEYDAEIEESQYKVDFGISDKSSKEKSNIIYPTKIDNYSPDNGVMDDIVMNSTEWFPFNLVENQQYNMYNPYIYSGEQTYEKKKKTLDESKVHKNEFDIDMYGGHSDIKELHPMMGSNTDTKMANRSKYMQLQSKLAMDIHAAYHKPQLQTYLEEELRETYEQRHWWENDQLSQEFGD